ncbi:MAG: hypothetical protein MJZ17_05715 [Bacteroidales bacterium]|nr:hypothetical protein [Bacteroidales bacterium]
MKVINKKVTVMVDIQDASTGGICLPHQAFPIACGNTMDILARVLIYSLVSGTELGLFNSKAVWGSLSGWHKMKDIRAGSVTPGTVAGNGSGRSYPAGLTSVPMYDLNSGMYRMSGYDRRYDATFSNVPLVKLALSADNARDAGRGVVTAWEAVIPKLYVIPKNGGGTVPKIVPGRGWVDMVEAPVPLLLSPWRKAIGDRLGVDDDYDEFRIESAYSLLMLEVMDMAADNTIYISHPNNIVPALPQNVDPNTFIDAATYNTLVNNGRSLRVRCSMSMDDKDPFYAFDRANRDKLVTLLEAGTIKASSGLTI